MVPDFNQALNASCKKRLSLQFFTWYEVKLVILAQAAIHSSDGTMPTCVLVTKNVA